MPVRVALCTVPLLFWVLIWLMSVVLVLVLVLPVTPVTPVALIPLVLVLAREEGKGGVADVMSTQPW